MDYFSIVKRAWEITKRYRFLWGLGVLAMFSEGGANFNGSNIGNWNTSLPPSGPTEQGDEGLPDTTLSFFRSTFIPKVSGADGNISGAEAQVDRVAGWLINNWQLAITIGVGILAVFLVILYVSYVARAGLVVAIDELEGRKNELTFGSAYHAGRQYFWRLFGFDILISLVAIGLLMIMIAPVILLFIAAGKSPAVLALAILLAIIVFLIFIVVIIYFGILRLLGSRALVINNLGIRASISYGHQMIINKKGYSVLAWLVSLLVGLVYGIALGIAVIIVGLILFAVGYGIYKAAGSVGQVPITVTMIGIFIALLMFVSGVFTSFISTYWTLTFRAIDYYFKKDKEISVNP